MECYLWILKDRNGMLFMNFKCQKLKDEFKKLLKYGISTHLGFNHYLTYTDIQEALWKKPGQ